MRVQFHLPLLTYPDPSSFALIQNAIDFARRQEAQLHVSVFEVKIPRVSPPFPPIVDVDKMSADAERSSRACATALIETVRDYAHKADQAAAISSFEATEPLVGDRIAEISRIYDLSIMETSPITSSVIERVLFQSGRPLLLFPADNCCGRIDTVAIAWDGSATLARALTGARAFLDNASKAVLISVTDDKAIDADLRDRFATLIRAGGLAVEIVDAQSQGTPVAAKIQSVAAESRADLLITGGFGHSRLRELILGGVTRSLLNGLEVPVLLCH
ncbi:Universal stress protein family protein [Rhizobium mongolense subsp. loessense]|uniref:Universal stress protein family protein n=1 Tax=Rhizobium mongolense subsp. loessense TaxID=158890 RepID=A0A1G4U416_9HYPH|nr:universal stress protein [Rhizobium mongolense]SCW87655.1 Universal stress protein family protein [Rhizobium mongolense subsp. loessense]